MASVPAELFVPPGSPWPAPQGLAPLQEFLVETLYEEGPSPRPAARSVLPLGESFERHGNVEAPVVVG